MTVNELTEIIERHAPTDKAMPYDNVGLLIGDGESEISGVVIAVDLTRDVIKKAVKIGANTVITHHPIIFNALKRLTTGNYEQDIVISAIKNSINVYACHTNADNAEYGLNYALAKSLGGENIAVLSDEGGVYADIDMEFGDFTNAVGKTVKGVMRVNPPKKAYIKRFAIITGSGGRDDSLVYRLKEISADCYITAEVAHNVRLAFIDSGIGLIEVGHYESERIFIDIVSGWLSESGLKITKAFNDAFSN